MWGRQWGELDYIFKHGPEIVKSPSVNNMTELGKHMGFDDMFWPDGDGFTMRSNCIIVSRLAEKFLMANDKDGFLSFCEKIKEVGIKNYIICLLNFGDGKSEGDRLVNYVLKHAKWGVNEA